jgi:pSer/pThr/pTyr-binding forkhead associated (FHA) protein
VLVDLEPLGPVVTIGRRLSCDVPLHWDLDVSRLHARLERLGADWTIVDDGTSRNGTWLNREPVAGRRRLCDGDLLRCGSTLLAFRCGDSGSEPTHAGVGAHEPVLADAQRKVLVALCRPYGSSSFAAPASNHQIAAELQLSVDAVKAQLRVLFRLYGLEDLPQNQKRAALAGRALEVGAISIVEL